MPGKERYPQYRFRVLLGGFPFGYLLSQPAGSVDLPRHPIPGQHTKLRPPSANSTKPWAASRYLELPSSQQFVFEEYQCQYTVNTLMCLNPNLSGSNHFGSIPLGSLLGLQVSVGESPNDNARVVNGYTIY